MRRFCTIVSWIVWACGFFIAASMTFTASDLVSHAREAIAKVPPESLRSPNVDLCLAGVMLVFSVGATILRRRMMKSPKIPSLDEVGGVFFWLSLLSFSVCFASATVVLALSSAATNGQVTTFKVFGVLSMLALILTIPRLPKAAAAASL